MQKMVQIVETIRDPETNEITHHNTAIGVTDDEGVTCIIPNGYVPLIEETPAEDIVVTLIPYPIERFPTSLVSRVNDAEANTSTLVFTFPEV